MKLLKLDPMTFLMLVVVLGVVLTMSTQASDGASTVASQTQVSQMQSTDKIANSRK
jgi:hypothetical protein